jgi:hypothetical protein
VGIVVALTPLAVFLLASQVVTTLWFTPYLYWPPTDVGRL